MHPRIQGPCLRHLKCAVRGPVCIPNVDTRLTRPDFGIKDRSLLYAPSRCVLRKRKPSFQNRWVSPEPDADAVHTFSTSCVVDKNGTQSAPGVCCLPSIAVVAYELLSCAFPVTTSGSEFASRHKRSRICKPASAGIAQTRHCPERDSNPPHLGGYPVRNQLFTRIAVRAFVYPVFLSRG
jgi:hypothetical protein